MIYPVQVKMARAALGWGVRELAEKAKLTANTISRYETTGSCNVLTVQAMERALIDAGIIFLPIDSSGGLGVRLL